MVGPDVISVSSNPQAQKILKRVEREATHRYQTLTLPEDGASNLFIVNGTLIHRCKSEAPKSDAVRFYKSLPYLTRGIYLASIVISIYIVQVHFIL